MRGGRQVEQKLRQRTQMTDKGGLGGEESVIGCSAEDKTSRLVSGGVREGLRAVSRSRAKKSSTFPNKRFVLWAVVDTARSDLESGSD